MNRRYREPFPWRYAFGGAFVLAVLILFLYAAGVFR